MAWKEKFIGFNKYSRPMTRITAVRKIVIHYTANNGATAMGHYNYFKNLSGRYASAHFMVDKIEALLIIPLNEMTYQANDGSTKLIPALRPNANLLSVGVEMCLEKNGSIHPETIRRTEDVVAELCRRYKLNPLTDVVRHYDITRKNCPAPWVANGSLFSAFKLRVNNKMKNPSKAPTQVSIDTTPLLQDGDSGEYVKDMQEFLVKKGFKIVPDGHFGQLTVDAVKKFQLDSKLDSDGVVGDATWKALKAVTVKPVSNPIVQPAQALDKNAKTHKVVSGDTFYSIAVYYGVGMEKLKTYNPKLNINKLDIGDVIQLKGTGAKPVVKPKPKPVVKPVAAKPKPKAKHVLTLKYSGYLMSGQSGQNVKSLQRALNYLSFNVGAVDGEYGKKTVDAVKRFQKVHLPKEVDGIAGQGTLKKINSLLN